MKYNQPKWATQVAGKYPKKTFFNKFEMKSHVELYFSYWLDELMDAGYIDSWSYETARFQLFDPNKRQYYKALKTKTKLMEEPMFANASCTADFTINWNIKSCNLFYLDPNIPIYGTVSTIPIRLGYDNENPSRLISFIETKGSNESTTSSSVSFPYKAKWVYQMYGACIQKIKPFSKEINKQILFQKTFYPLRVLQAEVYKVNCAGGRRGQSKIKHKVRTLEQYVNSRKQ